MAKRFFNWARNHHCRPQEYVQPGSEDELAAVVRTATTRGGRIRVIGAGHSWSAAAMSDDVLVNLDRLNKVLDVDHERHQVTVEAGIRLYQLTERLDEHGLAMSNLGSISEQSVAGAISTATHGTGIEFGNLSSQVLVVRLITADGSARDVRNTDTDLLRAARVSLGCLGVITQVTIQCEPRFLLEENSGPMPFEEALEKLPDVVAGNEHAKLWWIPHTDLAQIYRYNRTDRPPTGRTPALWWDQSKFSLWTYNGLLRAGRIAPAMIPTINRLVASNIGRVRRRVDRSDRIFNVPSAVPRHREMEYAIPVERAVTAIRGTRERIERSGVRVNFLVEARFVAGDDSYLSPTQGRPVCQLGAYMAETADLSAYYDLFETWMLEMGGRPHWGKEFFLRHHELAELYPEMPRFKAIREELDPHQAFVNDYVRRVLGV